MVIYALPENQQIVVGADYLPQFVASLSYYSGYRRSQCTRGLIQAGSLASFSLGSIGKPDLDFYFNERRNSKRILQNRHPLRHWADLIRSIERSLNYSTL